MKISIPDDAPPVLRSSKTSDEFGRRFDDVLVAVRRQQKLLTQCIAEETPESRGGWKQVWHLTPSALCMGRGEHGIPTIPLKTLQFPASLPINPFMSWARIRKRESSRIF